MLAEKLQRRFCDVDSCIEKAAGMSIADIFANEGEYSFRKREREALTYILEVKEQVIATGGGAVMDEDNVFKMRKGGQVVYLSAPVELWQSAVNAEERRRVRCWQTVTPKKRLNLYWHNALIFIVGRRMSLLNKRRNINKHRSPTKCCGVGDGMSKR